MQQLALRLAAPRRRQAAVQALARINADTNNTEQHRFFYLNLPHVYQRRLTEQAVLLPPPARPVDMEKELSQSFTAHAVTLSSPRVYA